VKVLYRGFEIDAHRDKSLGGDTLLYYSIFRREDGYELTSGFSSGDDKIRDYLGYMQGWVDDFLDGVETDG